MLISYFFQNLFQFWRTQTFGNIHLFMAYNFEYFGKSQYIKMNIKIMILHIRPNTGSTKKQLFPFSLLSLSLIPSLPLPPSLFHSSALSQFYFDPETFFFSQQVFPSNSLLFLSLSLFPSLPDIWLGSLPYTETNVMTSLHCNVPETQRERQ